MTILKKLFGGLKMGWPAIIAFAVVIGVLVGAICSATFLDNTSLHDIAVTPEWWVIFAFIIASNSSKNWEAALKIFVFFLISQPLIYGTEVLLGHLTADMAMYYYTSIWGPITLLTLPGGFIAYYIQKQNVLGSIVLGLGCSLQLDLGLYYALEFLAAPPQHLLTTVVCFGSVAAFTLALQESTRNRIIVLATSVATCVLILGFVAVRNAMLI